MDIKDIINSETSIEKLFDMKFLICKKIEELIKDIYNLTISDIVEIRHIIENQENYSDNVFDIIFKTYKINEINARIIYRMGHPGTNFENWLKCPECFYDD